MDGWGVMSNATSSVSGSRPVVDLANATIAHRGWDAGIHAEQETYDKWPVWARLLIIVGLSALLWAGIISAAVALFG